MVGALVYYEPGGACILPPAEEEWWDSSGLCPPLPDDAAQQFPECTAIPVKKAGCSSSHVMCCGGRMLAEPGLCSQCWLSQWLSQCFAVLFWGFPIQIKYLSLMIYTVQKTVNSPVVRYKLKSMLKQSNIIQIIIRMRIIII